MILTNRRTNFMSQFYIHPICTSPYHPGVRTRLGQVTTIFELLYGQEVRGLLDILKEEWEADRRSSECCVTCAVNKKEMEVMMDIVKENFTKAQ